MKGVQRADDRRERIPGPSLYSLGHFNYVNSIEQGREQGGELRVAFVVEPAFEAFPLEYAPTFDADKFAGCQPRLAVEATQAIVPGEEIAEEDGRIEVGPHPSPRSARRYSRGSWAIASGGGGGAKVDFACLILMAGSDSMGETIATGVSLSAMMIRYPLRTLRSSSEILALKAEIVMVSI